MALVVDTGDKYEFRQEFRNKAGNLSDPATVSLRIKQPSGTILGPFTWAATEVTRESLGLFYYEKTLDSSGRWQAEWTTTGEPTLKEYEDVVARESQFTGEPDNVLSDRALVTLEDALDYCEINPGDVELYDDLIRHVNAVSIRAHNVSGREFVSFDLPGATRVFDLDAFRFPRELQAELFVGDLADLDSISFDGTALTVDQFGVVVALPRVREEWEPYRRVRLSGLSYSRSTVVSVTGDWGFPAVPEDVRLAALRQIKYWYGRDLAKYSETFQEAEGAAATDRVPDSQRALMRSVYDTFVSYKDVRI